MIQACFLSSRWIKEEAVSFFCEFFTPILLSGNTGRTKSLAYKLPSPFPEGNQQVFIANYLETTYRKREQSLAQLVETIHAFADGKVGNYFVFFPSYQYLDLAAEAFKQQYPDSDVLIQETDMNEEERERFLAKFQSDPDETLIGFCVLGGIFQKESI